MTEGTAMAPWNGPDYNVKLRLNCVQQVSISTRVRLATFATIHGRSGYTLAFAGHFYSFAFGFCLPGDNERFLPGS